MPPKPVHKQGCTRRPRGTRGPEAGGGGATLAKPQTTLTVLTKVRLRATHEQPGLQTHQ